MRSCPYMSAPEQSNVDVTLGKTGFNPYRTSQFEDTDLWVKAGMSKEGADNYLGAIRESLQSPNMILDLRVPQVGPVPGRGPRHGGGPVPGRGADPRPGDPADRAGLGEDHRRGGRDDQKAAYASSLNIQR